MSDTSDTSEDRDEAGPPSEVEIATQGARDATPREELWLYAGAAISYIVCGFFVKQIFAWWWFGAAWLVAFVWLVPKAIDLVRGRKGDDR